MLHQVGMGWWGQKFAYYDFTASQNGIVQVRLPSHALFSAPIAVRYFFGVARSASYVSRSVDGKENLIAAVDVNDQNEPRRNFLLSVGAMGSFLEGHILDQAFLTKAPYGVSTTAILAKANQQGIPIHTVTATNIAAALPTLQITTDVRGDIENAINSNLRVTIPEHDVTVANYTGTGYFVEDPVTGTGAYLIDGGRNGGGGPESESIYPLPKVPAGFYGLVVGSSLRSAGMGLIAENGVIVGIAMPAMAEAGTAVGVGAGAAAGAALGSILIALLIALIILTAFAVTLEALYPQTLGTRYRHYTDVVDVIMAQFFRMLIASDSRATFGSGVYVADAVSETALGAGCPPGPAVQARFQIPRPVTGYIEFEITRPALYVIGGGTNSVGGVEYVIKSPLLPWPHPRGGIGRALYVGDYAFGLEVTNICP